MAFRSHARFHAAVLRRWAAGWSVILGLVFVGVTAVTLTLWMSDPGYAETTPVGDSAFFVLGAVVTVGLLSQTSVPERRVVGLQQALVGILALGAAGLAGDRIEPLVGSLVLLAVASILVVGQPGRAAALRPVGHPIGPVVTLAVLAAVPMGPYVADVLALARDAGPSCFLGQCAHGDRLAELAAAAVTVVLVALLAGLGGPGWRLALWSAGVGAAVIGAASLALTDAPGSLGSTGGALAVAWGVLLVVAGEVHARRPRAAPADDARLISSGSRRKESLR